MSEDGSQQVIADRLGVTTYAGLQCLRQPFVTKHLLERVGGIAGAIAKQQEHVTREQLNTSFVNLNLGKQSYEPAVGMGN